MTKYDPGVTDATMNDAVKAPSYIVQLCVVTIVPLRVHAVSLDEKPVPVTVTVVAALAEVGLKVMDAAPADVPKLSVAEAKSPSGLPVAVIVYVLAAIFATVNEPVKAPSEIEHVPAVTGLPANVQL